MKTLTVKELIEELSKYNPDADVYFKYDIDRYVNLEKVEPEDEYVVLI